MLTQELVEYAIPMNEYFTKKTKIMDEPENVEMNETIYERQVSEEISEIMSEFNKLSEKELSKPENKNVCNKQEENLLIRNNIEHNRKTWSEPENADGFAKTFTPLNGHEANEKITHKSDLVKNKNEKTVKDCCNKNNNDKMMFVAKIVAAVGISCGCLSVIILAIYLYRRKNTKNALKSKNNEI